MHALRVKDKSCKLKKHWWSLTNFKSIVFPLFNLPVKFTIFFKSSLLFNCFFCLFVFIKKTLSLSNLKTRTTMNAKISVFVICVETIINLLFFNLNDCTFKGSEYITWFFKQFIVIFSVIKQFKTFQIMFFHRANAWLRFIKFYCSFAVEFIWCSAEQPFDICIAVWNNWNYYDGLSPSKKVFYLLQWKPF